MISVLPLLALFSLFSSAMSASTRLVWCDVSKVQLKLPSGQTQLAVPTGLAPKFIAIGVGVQNYTCSSAGTFTSIGALATLFDASCVAKLSTSALDDLPEVALDAFKVDPSIIKFLGMTPLKLGQHLFVTNPITGSGIVARFDFTSSQKNSNDFVDASKTGDIPSPTKPTQNVDWLELTNITGELAQKVFRVVTEGGQPPTSCTGAAATSIPYAAEYWFYD